MKYKVMCSLGAGSWTWATCLCLCLLSARLAVFFSLFPHYREIHIAPWSVLSDTIFLKRETRFSDWWECSRSLQSGIPALNQKEVCQKTWGVRHEVWGDSGQGARHQGLRRWPCLEGPCPEGPRHCALGSGLVCRDKSALVSLLSDCSDHLHPLACASPVICVPMATLLQPGLFGFCAPDASLQTRAPHSVGQTWCSWHLLTSRDVTMIVLLGMFCSQNKALSLNSQGSILDLLTQTPRLRLFMACVVGRNCILAFHLSSYQNAFIVKSGPFSTLFPIRWCPAIFLGAHRRSINTGGKMNKVLIPDTKEFVV